MDRGTAEGKSSSRQGPRTVRLDALLFGLAVLCLAPWSIPPARAQDGNPAVIVNQDILNNLEWAAAAAARARAQAGAATALLAPPETAPQSRVLVEPVHQAAAAPPIPTAKPQRSTEAAQTPETSAAEPAAPDAKEEDATPGFAIATAPAATEPPAAEPLPAVPLPPEPPAPEEISLAEVPPPPEPPAAPTAESPQAPAAAAETADESAPATTPAETQTAMVASPKLAAGEFRLLFEAGATTLSESAKGKLAALAEQLRAEPKRRIQVQAFAGGAANARDARRLSLSRAVAVRGFLIEQGLPAGQIDVRALGGDSGSGPADRVDVLDARR